MDKKQRDSVFELARIISMIAIIASHITSHGANGYDAPADIPVYNSVFLNIIIVGGQIGVSLFTLISAYFLSAKKFHPKTLLKTIAQTFFYSSIIFFIFAISGNTATDGESFAKNLLPILHQRYWFVSCYVGMYLLSPLMNLLISKCSKDWHFFIIIIALFIVGQVVPFFLPPYFWKLACFLDYYAIAAYLRKRKNKITENTVIWLTLFIITYATIISASVFYKYFMAHLNNVVGILCAVSLFCLFKNAKNRFCSKWVNLIASTTFGIYLIHENPLIRFVLWIDLLKCNEVIYAQYFIPLAFCWIITIFVVCSIIDLIRQFAVEKPFFTAVDKIGAAIERRKETKTQN